MSKTDKELAVELTVALINANPRIKFTVSEAGTENISPSLNADDVAKCVLKYHTILKQLD